MLSTPTCYSVEDDVPAQSSMCESLSPKPPPEMKVCCEETCQGLFFSFCICKCRYLEHLFFLQLYRPVLQIIVTRQKMVDIVPYHLFIEGERTVNVREMTRAICGVLQHQTMI